MQLLALQRKAASGGTRDTGHISDVTSSRCNGQEQALSAWTQQHCCICNSAHSRAANAVQRAQRCRKQPWEPVYAWHTHHVMYGCTGSQQRCMSECSPFCCCVVQEGYAAGRSAVVVSRSHALYFLQALPLLQLLPQALVNSAVLRACHCAGQRTASATAGALLQM